MSPQFQRFAKPSAAVTIAASLLTMAFASAPAHAGTSETFKFNMVRTPSLVAVPGCLPYVKGHVQVKPLVGAEQMTVSVTGLPPNTDFNLFVIQAPNAPFGMAWYQGDIESDYLGNGSRKFIGRFNEETFIVAPGSIAAPDVHHDNFPDAGVNPQTAPVHTYHVGLWFNSAADAVKAGCPGNVTPFSGEHTAGVQVLNTSNYPDLSGPLLHVKP